MWQRQLRFGLAASIRQRVGSKSSHSKQRMDLRQSLQMADDLRWQGWPDLLLLLLLLLRLRSTSASAYICNLHLRSVCAQVDQTCRELWAMSSTDKHHRQATFRSAGNPSSRHDCEIAGANEKQRRVSNSIHRNTHSLMISTSRHIYTVHQSIILCTHTNTPRATGQAGDLLPGDKLPRTGTGMG